MPWTPSDAKRFSKKASGSKGGAQQWSSIANAVLDKSGDEGKAVRIASGVVKKSVAKATPKSPTKGY